jgi:deazaflavin-dependent oxidoreductase (nitroreductase family)
MKTQAGPIVRTFVRPMLMRAGIAGVLEVPSRRTGKPTHVCLAIYDMPGGRYILSSYATSNWVRNLRAAGRGTITVRSKTEPFTAVEVGPDERDAVIAFFKKKAPRPFHWDFEQWPDPADHPAFRLDPDDAATSPPGT